MQDATESLELYEALLRKASDVCSEVCRYPKPSDPSATRIWDASHEFLAYGNLSRAMPDARPMGGAAFEALDKLHADWPELHSAALTGEIAYAGHPDLWRRLMYEAPMGTYASLAAGHINSRLRPGQKVIELGAGVGNTTRLLKIPPGVLYVRTDKSLLLMSAPDLPGTAERYDFDGPSPIRDADLIFAVNALHCAEHPRRTLSFIRAMLRPGGMVMLAEGEPRPADNRPWALDVLFCQFSGWWDRTGFRSRSHWIDDLVGEGYMDIGYQRLLAGKYDLGGLIWARC